MQLILGVDGGGTGCRAAVADLSGHVLGRGEAGAANIASEPDGAAGNIRLAVEKALGQAGVSSWTFWGHNFLHPQDMPPIVPPYAPGLQQTLLHVIKQKTRSLRGEVRVSWMLLNCKKQNCGAGSRNRTGTMLPPRDFESRASTSSAIPARFTASIDL